LCGQPGIARKIEVGFAAFLVTNSPAVDRNHKFSSSNLRRLAAALHPAEREQYMLVWAPSPGSTASTSTSEIGLRQDHKTLPTVSSNSKCPRTREELVQEMQKVPCNWTTFTLNMGAFLYKLLFDVEVGSKAWVKDRAVLRALGLENHQEVVLQNCFREYK
jgi:hypothetical protein